MRSLFSLVFVLVGLAAVGAQAQQVSIGTPFHNLSDSFFERNGVSWSGNWRGANFSVGGATNAQPQFGGFDPGAGLTTNFALTGKHGQANFALNFGQGSRRSLVSQTPSVTLMNGQTGYFSDTSQTPFVISQIPIVGGVAPVMNFNPAPSMFSLPVDPGIPRGIDPRIHAMAVQRAQQHAAAVEDEEAIQRPLDRKPQVGGPNKNGPPQAALMNIPPVAPVIEAAGPVERLAAAQESSAGRAAPSVAEAKRLHEMEKGGSNNELLALMERAKAAEEDGKANVAKIYYQMVARRADGELREQAQERLDAIRGTANP